MRISERRGGPIAYMARHRVAANLMMVFLILGGLLMASRTEQELFPDFDRGQVSVTIALPGATPEEVEQSIALAVEAVLADTSGIERYETRVTPGSAFCAGYLSGERDGQAVLAEVEQGIARITSFPDEASDPFIRLADRDDRVVTLELHGDVARRDLRMAAERLRAELELAPGIGRVDLVTPGPLEIQVEVAQARLRALGLTLDDLARTLRQSAGDRAGGELETPGGDLLVRLDERRAAAREFAEIPVVADRAGTVLRLGEIARVREGFEDTDRARWFDGAPTIGLSVRRLAGQTPVGVSEAVRRALPGAMAGLPEALDVTITEDDSVTFQGRLDLLVWNGLTGLCLVLLLLGLFLEARLAFWVAMGIPTAFLGTLLVLDPAGATINMVTMFAFILALGIVVDDAIVVGENIHDRREAGMAPADAAIAGARDIAVPLAFSILTNIVAFLPLAMIPGIMGQFFMWIPLVVAAAFLFSWLEALFVLPAHLAGLRPRGPRPPTRLERLRAAIGAGLAWATARLYAPLLRRALAWRYTTVAAMVGLSMVVMALPVSGQMGYSLFPPVPRDVASLSVSLPVGVDAATKERVRGRITAAAERVIAENGGAALSRGVYSGIDASTVEAEVHLTPPGTRPMATGAFAAAWREAVGTIPEARAQRYRASFGGPGGETSLEVALSHPDSGTLTRAARRLVERLSALGPVRDPDDGFAPGKAQLEFRLTEPGRALGLTAESVGRQVRAAFQGIEVLAQQEGRNEVTLRLRLPAGERDGRDDIERLLIATPAGGEVPLHQIAEAVPGRAAARIDRTDGRRTVTVTANVVPDSETGAVTAALSERILPALAAEFPGLDHAFGGRQEASRETADSFVQVSIPLTLALMFVLLAVLFRSYAQPLIVLAAIPFGAVGAVLGHMIMGMSLSMVSIFGVIALSGVVINAAIVMLDLANRLRAEGVDPAEAIWRAGVRRFRPILLTTLTTFGGLAPMIFETSRQAQFLIPMAVSLGYGILFATLIVMLFVPALFLIAEDIRWLANPRPRPVRAG